ncbi:Glycosyltransferase involved in cell wall bisynthesis [Quadrisphaera granulorum]|uniref:Glycosyltransferase involved in cell wall biosynthesis n=1 Tax=Quadrisphaera granulorum TaxID=317664 RepID=A0A315ZCV6_9ACTN|nr:glycosyltransferase [Quadrisphaera granulorum]PWJ43415.1 glycosyltransferase involved in cell wall biosynthesis [Quadrisphaera granulorum]SZE99214.1 Glycosyltransferase involved in cell wall bisynthesis [Quadrisphaera granulorum]
MTTVAALASLLGRRPRIAIIGSRGYPSYYGGFETLVRRMAPYLHDEGWDVTVYSRPGATRSDDPGLRPEVRSVVTRGLESKSLSTLSYSCTSSVHAAWEKPDVAFLMNVACGYWLPLLKVRGIPTVLNVDGIEWDRAKWSRLGKAVFLNGARISAKFADTLVYDADELERIWREKFHRDGVVIAYGGDIPAPLPVVDGLERRGYALMVARFVPENTVNEFFDAAKIISKAADVVVVGSSGYGGELDERAKALADSNERVHWLGHVSDDDKLFSLWQHAGAYFHGHSVGGTNPALVQALACGAPVVARDTPYNREVLGGTGTLVKPEAPAIANAVLSLLADRERQERHSAEAVQRIRDAYLWDSICGAYCAAFVDAASPGTRSRRPG